MSKKQNQSLETRERIFNGAMRLFQEKGFDRTTMRDIATAADTALGSTYHHFNSKDDIVMVFYQGLLQEEAAWAQEADYQQMNELEDRIRYLILKKLDQLSQHRQVLEGVFRKALDPKSPLSPFSQETRQIREGNIALFAQALNESQNSLHDDFKPVLPKMIWLYEMGIILAWFYDRSSGQSLSRKLLDISLPLLQHALEALGLPLMGGFRQNLVGLCRLTDEIMEEPKGEPA